MAPFVWPGADEPHPVAELGDELDRHHAGLLRQLPKDTANGATDGQALEGAFLGGGGGDPPAASGVSLVARLTPSLFC